MTVINASAKTEYSEARIRVDNADDTANIKSKTYKALKTAAYDAIDAYADAKVEYVCALAAAKAAGAVAEAARITLMREEYADAPSVQVPQTIEKMVVDASPEEAAALARVGIEDNDRLQYIYTLISMSGEEEVEGAAPTIKSLVQILDHLPPWQLIGADTWSNGEWTLFVRVKGSFDTKTRNFRWRPRGLNKPELELLDTLLNPLYSSPEEID
jgi:hypothetical protein